MIYPEALLRHGYEHLHRAMHGRLPLSPAIFDFAAITSPQRKLHNPLCQNLLTFTPATLLNVNLAKPSQDLV